MRKVLAGMAAGLALATGACVTAGPDSGNSYGKGGWSSYEKRLAGNGPSERYSGPPSGNVSKKFNNRL
jgi:hypothetical protein